jgi:hypothetical protein
VESEEVATLFALLNSDAPDAVSFFAAPEVATSRSRTSLGGAPIFNSGVIGLRRDDELAEMLLRRWAAVQVP